MREHSLEEGCEGRSKAFTGCPRAEGASHISGDDCCIGSVARKSTRDGRSVAAPCLRLRLPGACGGKEDAAGHGRRAFGSSCGTAEVGAGRGANGEGPSLAVVTSYCTRECVGE